MTAQKNAGVMKRFGQEMEPGTFIEHVGKYYGKAFADEVRQLEHAAELGKRYLKDVKNDIVRIGILLDCGFDNNLLQNITSKMDENELIAFKGALESKLDKMLPPVTQLPGYQSEKGGNMPEPEFII